MIKNWVGFYTLSSREIMRFFSVWRQTIIPGIVTTLLYIFVFGVALENRISEIGGVSYKIYILPGNPLRLQNRWPHVCRGRMEHQVYNHCVMLHFVDDVDWVGVKAFISIPKNILISYILYCCFWFTFYIFLSLDVAESHSSS